MNTTRIRIWKSFATNNDTELEKLSDLEKFIISTIKNKTSATANEIVNDPNNTFGKQTVTRHTLNSLVNQKFLVKQRRGRSFVYSLNPQNDYLNQVKHLKHLEDNILK